jgi:hypothetical protein
MHATDDSERVLEVLGRDDDDGPAGSFEPLTTQVILLSRRASRSWCQPSYSTTTMYAR